MQVAPFIPAFFLLAFQGPIDVAAEEKGRSSFLARFLTSSLIMFLCLWIRSWLHDYERVLALAVRLIYIQIGCSIFGSLGALFSGLLLIDLALGLFALVAIDRSSERLGRTYAVLLICAIILDVQWFILFSRIIWNAEPEKFGVLFVFSVKLTMAMQIIGFSTRFFSLFLWIQIYRLGASNVICRVSPEAVVEDCEAADVGSSLSSPKPYKTWEQCSDSNINSVDSIYDPPFLCTSEITNKVDERNNLRPCETLRKCSESDDDFEDFIYNPTLLPILFQEAKDETRLQKAKEKISASNNSCINEPLQESEASHLNLCSNRQVRIVQVGTAVPRPYIP